MYVKEKGRLTNNDYQQLDSVSRQTASRELAELIAMSILRRIGKTGKSTFYELTPISSNASQTPQTPHEHPKMRKRGTTKRR